MILDKQNKKIGTQQRLAHKRNLKKGTKPKQHYWKIKVQKV